MTDGCEVKSHDLVGFCPRLYCLEISQRVTAASRGISVQADHQSGMMEDFGGTLTNHIVDSDDYFTLDNFVEDMDGDGFFEQADGDGDDDDNVGLDDLRMQSSLWRCNAASTRAMTYGTPR